MRLPNRSHGKERGSLAPATIPAARPLPALSASQGPPPQPVTALAPSKREPTCQSPWPSSALGPPPGLAPSAHTPRSLLASLLPLAPLFRPRLRPSMPFHSVRRTRRTPGTRLKRLAVCRQARRPRNAPRAWRPQLRPAQASRQLSASVPALPWASQSSWANEPPPAPRARGRPRGHLLEPRAR